MTVEAILKEVASASNANAGAAAALRGAASMVQRLASGPTHAEALNELASKLNTASITLAQPEATEVASSPEGSHATKAGGARAA